jgi:hypothetical protein
LITFKKLEREIEVEGVRRRAALYAAHESSVDTNAEAAVA